MSIDEKRLYLDAFLSTKSEAQSQTIAQPSEDIKKYQDVLTSYNELVDNTRYKIVSPYLIPKTQKPVEIVSEPILHSIPRKSSTKKTDLLNPICSMSGCNRHKRIGTVQQNYQYCAGDICGNRNRFPNLYFHSGILVTRLL